MLGVNMMKRHLSQEDGGGTSVLPEVPHASCWATCSVVGFFLWMTGWSWVVSHHRGQEKATVQSNIDY